LQIISACIPNCLALLYLVELKKLFSVTTHQNGSAIIFKTMYVISIFDFTLLV
jgi:hypothetical protein